MVLCSQSAFFKSAVDPRNNFSDPYCDRIRLDEEEPAAVRALLEYLYRFEYDVPRDNDKGALFLFHIKVCAIGEVYGVKGLRDQAIDRAKIVFENAPTLKELRMDLAIKAIYDMDVATDSGLRHLIVELCKVKIHELLEMGEFSEAMDSVGCFGNDLVRALVSTLPPSTALSTPKTAASTSDVSLPLIIKGPSHGVVDQSNTRTSAVDPPGLFIAQENAHDGIGKGKVSEGTTASGNQETSKAQLPARDIVNSHGASASNSTLLTPLPTQPITHANTRETSASNLGAPGSSNSPATSLATFAKTNLSSCAVLQPSTARKSMSVIGLVHVPGLPYIQRSIVNNSDHAFKPHVDKNISTSCNDTFQSIESQLLYQRLSREEVRLADYCSGIVSWTSGTRHTPSTTP
ncbi:hypothetical protein BKA80DRAFT_115061 [Phyllosticta citrichinensis]